MRIAWHDSEDGTATTSVLILLFWLILAMTILSLLKDYPWIFWPLVIIVGLTAIVGLALTVNRFRISIDEGWLKRRQRLREQEGFELSFNGPPWNKSGEIPLGEYELPFLARPYMTVFIPRLRISPQRKMWQRSGRFFKREWVNDLRNFIEIVNFKQKEPSNPQPTKVRTDCIKGLWVEYSNASPLYIVGGENLVGTVTVRCNRKDTYWLGLSAATEGGRRTSNGKIKAR